MRYPKFMNLQKTVKLGWLTADEKQSIEVMPARKPVKIEIKEEPNHAYSS